MRTGRRHKQPVRLTNRQPSLLDQPVPDTLSITVQPLPSGCDRVTVLAQLENPCRSPRDLKLKELKGVNPAVTGVPKRLENDVALRHAATSRPAHRFAVVTEQSSAAAICANDAPASRIREASAR